MNNSKDDDHENDEHDHDEDEHEHGKSAKDRPDEGCFPPIGACFPVVPGAKHKFSREYKLAKIADGIRVPSSIAASTMHMARRFLRGKAAANSLEKSVFPLFRRLPQGLLSCTVSAFDDLSVDQRNRLFAESLLLEPNKPIDEKTFADALRQEIVQRVGIQVFGDPKGVEEERPGLIRVFPPGGEIPPNQIHICTVNGLRTASFSPSLNLDDYLPAELQRECKIIMVDGQPQTDCQVLTTNCPGHSKADLAGNQVCIRVLDIPTGDSVVLEGVNFFSIDAKVRFNDIQTGTAVRDVDTHVWGDIDTPVQDEAGQLINDCRVKDRLTFQVPDDLPSALYRIQVVVPNITGDSAFGTNLVSDEEYINVIPPSTARFEIVEERIICREETSPSWAGSDELGMHTLAAAIDLNFQLIALPNLKEPTDANKRNQLQDQRFEEEDMDTGNFRITPRKLFVHDQPIIGMLLVVLGDEIDSQGAYEKQITDSMDIFIDTVKKQVEIIAGALAGGLLSGKISFRDILKFASKHPVLLAIAGAILIAVDIIYAEWAPADPLIRDSIALSVTELDELTSVSVPAPDPRSFTAENGIVVKVNQGIAPVKKPTEYHEARAYIGEDSNYEIIYRYNRVA